MGSIVTACGPDLPFQPEVAIVSTIYGRPLGSERRLPLESGNGGGLGGIGEVGAVHTGDSTIGTRSTRSSFAVRSGIEGSYPCINSDAHWWSSDCESYLG